MIIQVEITLPDDTTPFRVNFIRQSAENRCWGIVRAMFNEEIQKQCFVQANEKPKEVTNDVLHDHQ